MTRPCGIYGCRASKSFNVCVQVQATLVLMKLLMREKSNVYIGMAWTGNKAYPGYFTDGPTYTHIPWVSEGLSTVPKNGNGWVLRAGCMLRVFSLPSSIFNACQILFSPKSPIYVQLGHFAIFWSASSYSTMPGSGPFLDKGSKRYNRSKVKSTGAGELCSKERKKRWESVKELSRYNQFSHQAYFITVKS